MKPSALWAIPLVVFLATFQSTPAQTTTPITVSGKIVDSAGLPLADAMVIFFFDVSRTATSMDSIVTEANGTFSRQISVQQGSEGIGYAVFKSGFFPVYDEGSILAGNVDLGTIALQKGGGGKPATVTGRVVDSLTGLPLSAVTVSLMVLFSPTVGNPPQGLRSGSDGTFSLTMIVDTAAIKDTTSIITVPPCVMFTASKEGYQTRTGGSVIAGFDPIDLGDIQLTTPQISVLPARRSPVRSAQVSTSGYTLKGQKIPANRLASIKRFSQPIIVEHRYSTDDKKAKKRLLTEFTKPTV